jgi:hypothetical protein
MLINVPYKVGDVISMKLASGEELVGRLEEEQGDDMIVTKPMMLVSAQDGIGLAPFMFSVSPDTKFKIKVPNVLCVTKTEDSFSKQYLEQTSGIQL